MAVEAILKKGVVWYRRGPESRAACAQTLFVFSNLDPIDFGALGGVRA
jgi:hypothetical protein